MTSEQKKEERRKVRVTCQECGGSGETMFEDGRIECCENCDGNGWTEEVEHERAAQ